MSTPASAAWRHTPSFPPPSNYPVLSWQFGPLGALFFGPIMDPRQGLDDCRAVELRPCVASSMLESAASYLNDLSGY